MTNGSTVILTFNEYFLRSSFQNISLKFNFTKKKLKNIEVLNIEQTKLNIKT